MEQVIRLLLSKLRRPLHISYISENILKTDMNNTLDVLNDLSKKKLVVKSSYGNGYYVKAS
jgi:hypothetical protein